MAKPPMMTCRSILQFFAITVGFTVCPAMAEQVEFNFERNIEIRQTQVPYTLELSLSSLSPVRVGLETILDLSEVQRRLPDLLSGVAVVDICNTNIAIGRLKAAAENESIAIAGEAEAEFYACERDKLKPTDRGELLFSQAIALAAQASVQVRDNCVYFDLQDLQIAQDGPLELTADQKEFLEQAQSLLLEASDRILSKFPICPQLPPELASLDPDYTAGGTREIGEGGVGVFLQASIDVSTATILDVLHVLQDQGVLPPEP